MNTKKYWFPAKKYGWGWGPPNCWQGWVVLAIWLACLFGGVFFVRYSVALFVVYSVVLGTIFSLVVFIKGERPRWRWGKD
jgi:hypothetical protein